MGSDRPGLNDYLYNQYRTPLNLFLVFLQHQGKKVLVALEQVKYLIHHKNQNTYSENCVLTWD